MVEDTGEHQMEEMHGAGYVGRGLEFPCFLWVPHSPSISPCSAFWKLYEHFTLGIFTETSKFGIGVQNEAGQRLTEFCQENALVIANTLFQQHERWLHTWTSPDGQYKNQTDYILCSWRWRSCIQSAKTRPGADCGSDHEFLIAKFRLKLEKVGKTTRPFRYDLNQIPYDYTAEVMNRFKGPDLIDRVPEELWTEAHNPVQVVVTKTIPKKKKCK